MATNDDEQLDSNEISRRGFMKAGAASSPLLFSMPSFLGNVPVSQVGEPVADNPDTLDFGDGFSVEKTVTGGAEVRLADLIQALQVQALTATEVFLGQVDSTPSDSAIGEGNIAVYAKSDGNLYKKPHGGSEAIVGGSGGGTDVSVSEDDTTVESAASDINFIGIGVSDDGDGTVTVGETFDMGEL